MKCWINGFMRELRLLRVIRLGIVGVALGVGIFPEYVLAHRLSVFAWIEGDTVFVEGRLSSGKHLRKGNIYVYDGNEKLLFKTEVDDEGTARFALPKSYETGLKIVINAGEGHESYWILTPLDIENQREKKE